jgi:hypothetical protein
MYYERKILLGREVLLKLEVVCNLHNNKTQTQNMGLTLHIAPTEQIEILQHSKLMAETLHLCQEEVIVRTQKFTFRFARRTCKETAQLDD